MSREVVGKILVSLRWWSGPYLCPFPSPCLLPHIIHPLSASSPTLPTSPLQLLGDRVGLVHP